MKTRLQVVACLVPVGVSWLLLAAHFLRHQNLLVSGLCLACLASLAIPRPLIARLNQFVLLAGSLEWLRTAWVLATPRLKLGLPWHRLVLILAGVALLTAGSALLFRTRVLRQYFRLIPRPLQGP